MDKHQSSSNPASRLALGTVQFGLDYGIANSRGKVSEEEAARILDLAAMRGITTIDTAIAYGDSETLLGRHDLSNFQIVTKLPALPDTVQDVATWVDDELTKSLKRLNVRSVDALLLHSANDLSGPGGNALYEALQKAKADGKAKKTGWSVYSPENLERIPDSMHADLVQVPFNVFDRRMLHSGWLKKLKHRGTEIHARSAFLQGLLLMSPDSRPAFFSKWKDVFSAWDSYLENTGASALATCLAYSLSISDIDRVVIGVDGLDHLKAILDLELPDELPELDLPQTMPEELVNPSLWSIG